MLVTNQLTSAQQKIMRQVCYIQLESLKRLIENKSYVDPDVIEEVMDIDITEEEFMEDLEQRIIRFKKFEQDPHILAQMKDDDLSSIRHILTNIQHKYEDKYPNAIKNLWKRLFFVEDIKNINQN